MYMFNSIVDSSERRSTFADTDVQSAAFALDMVQRGMNHRFVCSYF